MGLPPEGDEASQSNSLGPLIKFAAGPGTIAAVVTLAAVHTPTGLPMTAIVAAVIGAGVTLATLLLAIGAGSHLVAACSRWSPGSWGSLWRPWECSLCSQV